MISAWSVQEAILAELVAVYILVKLISCLPVEGCSAASRSLVQVPWYHGNTIFPSLSGDDGDGGGGGGGGGGGCGGGGSGEQVNNFNVVHVWN